MKRFVRLFRYDPEKDPNARLRVDYDPDFGNAVLSDENTHPEQVDNPDANHLEVLESLQLTTKEVKWLAETMAELAAVMEDEDRAAQVEVDRIRRIHEQERLAVESVWVEFGPGGEP